MCWGPLVCRKLDYLRSDFNLNSTVLKLGHHGSKSSSSVDFLKAINPVCAVISCGEDNSYGHPHAETLNNLRAMGIYVFRTDEQGSIVATSDGKTISWNCNPSESWQAGEPKGSSQDDYYINESSQSTNDDSSLEIKYIINTNTKKFHYPTCSSVSDMKDKNKKESMDSRDDIISQGYSPCKRCNP